MSETTIYRRILDIMKQVGVIGKNQDAGGGGNFKFRGIDDVYDALQPALIEHGVVVVPQVLEQEVRDSQTSSGKFTQLATVRVKWTFYAEDGSNVEAITGGAATDGQGRALAQAQTDAFKKAIFQTLCIPVKGETDPESAMQPLEGAGRDGTPEIVMDGNQESKPVF